MNNKGKLFVYFFWVAVGMAIGFYLTKRFLC